MGDIAFFFMRSPMQRKHAAKTAHGARGEQGAKTFPTRLRRPAYGSLLFHSMRAARRAGGKNFPYSIAQAGIRKYAAYGMEGG